MSKIEHIERLTLVLDYRCNLDCPYCPVHNLQTIKEPMDKLSWRKAIERISGFLPDDTPVFISGGEPTYNFDLLCFVIKTLSLINKKSFLITNAMLLNESRIKSLCEFGLSGIQTTFHFYYIRDQESLMKKMIQTIEKLRLFKSFGVGVTTLSVNFSSSSDLLILSMLGQTEIFYDLVKGVDVLELAILNNEIKLSDNDNIIKQLRQYTEVEIYNYSLSKDNDVEEVVITPDGFILPSEVMYPIMLRNKQWVLRLKNIMDSDFTEILNSNSWNKYKSSLSDITGDS